MIQSNVSATSIAIAISILTASTLSGAVPQSETNLFEKINIIPLVENVLKGGSQRQFALREAEKTVEQKSDKNPALYEELSADENREKFIKSTVIILKKHQAQLHTSETQREKI